MGAIEKHRAQQEVPQVTGFKPRPHKARTIGRFPPIQQCSSSVGRRDTIRLSPSDAQGFHETAPDGGCHERRDCIADLPQLVCRGPSESEPIGEGLNPRCLANRQRPMLLGVNSLFTVSSPRSNARSCRAQRHSPLRGLTRKSGRIAHGMMWLAMSNDSQRRAHTQQRVR